MIWVRPGYSVLSMCTPIDKFKNIPFDGNTISKLGILYFLIKIIT